MSYHDTCPILTHTFFSPKNNGPKIACTVPIRYKIWWAFPENKVAEVSALWCHLPFCPCPLALNMLSKSIYQQPNKQQCQYQNRVRTIRMLYGMARLH